MKKIYLIIGFVLSYTQLSSQSFSNTTIYTPNNTAIEGKILTSGDWTSSQKTSIKNQTLAAHPNATFLADATWSYNCHGYAWHISEGQSPIVWINAIDDNNIANVDKYWTDGSFIRVCNESDADKIHYYNGDHSAVYSTSVSGKYESKWGADIRIRHDPTDVPSIYNGSFRNYYASTKISGNTNTLCTGTRTFSVKNISSATYSWTYSSAVTVSGATNTNQLVVQRNGSADEMAWVEVSMNTSCNSLSAAVTRIYFKVGAPNEEYSVLPYSSEQSICTNSYSRFKVEPQPGDGAYYEWGYIDLYGSSSPVVVNYSGSVEQNMVFDYAATYEVYARKGNSCGLGPTRTLVVEANDCFKLMSGAFKLSPNPTSSFINITLANNKGRLSLYPKENILQMIVVDKMGAIYIKRQFANGTKQARINVSNLKPDIYFVKIWNGKVWSSLNFIKN